MGHIEQGCLHAAQGDHPILQIHCRGTRTHENRCPRIDQLGNRNHPRLLILVLSVRDFEKSVDFPLQDVAESDWAQQNLGQPSLRGWALNSLYGYRYLLSLEYWLTPSNRARFFNTWREITKEGFSPLYGQGEALALPPQGLIFQRGYLPAQNGFDQLMALKEKGVNVLIIDAPIRPDLFNAHRDNYFQPYIDYMQAALAERGIPFWGTRSRASKHLCGLPLPG